VDRNLKIILKDEEFIFDFRRAIFWPRKKILLTADLHWGKTQFLRNHGIAISDNVFEADLKRLADLIEDYQVQTCLVLGDLIHHERALTQGIIEKVAYFRHQHPCELILVKGNHDRFTKFPESWGIVEESIFYQQGFSFRHEFEIDEKHFQFSGHLHPTLRLKAGHDSLRLPAFIFSEQRCLLPAFSHLTGGQDVKLLSGDSAVVVLEDSVERIK
jgi:DNA ligase-associated metallophosphoesterase